MRRFVLVASTLGVMLWIGIAVWAAGRTPRFDTSGLHAVGIVFILPALVLGLIGRWLGLAAFLVCFAGFMYLSVYVGGQISNY